MDGRVQAAGGGRLSMAASSGCEGFGTGRMFGETKRRNTTPSPANRIAGRVVVTGCTGCVSVGIRWSLRRKLSVSEVFCTAKRSSLTEMTGNRIAIRTTIAINCRHLSDFRSLSLLLDPQSHKDSRTAATPIHARLRKSSKLDEILS